VPTIPGCCGVTGAVGGRSAPLQNASAGNVRLERVCRVTARAAFDRHLSRRVFFAGLLGGAAIAASSSVGGRDRGQRIGATIDFGTVRAVKSMSGFLNSIHDPLPPRGRIEALRPRLWRSNALDQYDNIRSWGAKFQAPLSDGWGYPLSGRWIPPYRDFSRWEDYVRRIASQTIGKDIYWDIWNEPDTAGSWRGSLPSFFETWSRASRVLKEVLGPSTLVGGPSISRFQPDLIRDLLRHCRDVGAECNFITWHELEPWADIKNVEDNLRLARRSFVDNPEFSSVRLSEIHIHEFVGEVDQYRPAELLAFLWHLERGGADAASRSCWGNNCENNSIDGIIDPINFMPRADWWVHKYYATGTDHRAQSNSEYSHLIVLGQAVRSEANPVHAMIGYYGHEGGRSESIDVSLRLTGVRALVAGSAARVKITRIPDSGDAPIPDLPVVSDRIVGIENDTMLLEIDRLLKHEVQTIAVLQA
jgi:xylan 1,4-beta-xylosidase